MSRDLKPFVGEPVCCPCPEHGEPQRMACSNLWLVDNNDMGNGVATFRYEGRVIFSCVQIL